MSTDRVPGRFVDVDRVLRKAAEDGASWDLGVVAPRLRRVVAEAEAAGLLDAAALDALDDAEAEVTAILGEAFAGRFLPACGPAGRSVSSSVFGSKDYANRLDRQLAVGASAASLLFAEESFLVAVAEVVRRLVLAGGPLRPAWPPEALLPREARAVEGTAVAGGSPP